MKPRPSKSKGKILLIDAPVGVNISPLTDEFKKHGWVGWDLLGLTEPAIDDQYQEFPIIASVHHISKAIKETEPSVNVVLGRYWPYALALLRNKGIQGANLESIGPIVRERHYFRVLPDSRWRLNAPELRTFARHHESVSHEIAPKHQILDLGEMGAAEAMQSVLDRM